MINLFRDIPFSKPNFYFDVNGKKFLNNIDALIEASKTANPNMEFVLDYDVYRNSNLWSVEPQANIKECFVSHAKIIGEKYDDITIHYSGGTDSQTVLDAFIAAGVRNVKLWHRYPLDQRGFKPREKIFDSTKKSFIEKYKNKITELGYTVIGMDDDQYMSYGTLSTKGSLADWYLSLENLVGDYEMVVKDPESYRHYHSRHKEVIRNDKKSCMIWGFEKPYVQLRGNGQWTWATASRRWLTLDTPSAKEYDTIYFFMSDEVPEIQIKLTWLKIEAIEKIISTHGSVTLEQAKILSKEIQDLHSPYYTYINEYMGYKALNDLLNGNYWRSSPDYSSSRKFVHMKREESGINRTTNDFFQEKILNNVDSKFITPDNSLVSIASKEIYIRKHRLDLKV